jgi:hypothetical protein
MRRCAVPIAAALTLVGLTVAPATATTDQRGCPPPFRPITLADAYSLPHYADLSQEEVAAIFASIDQNGDTYLCLLPLPLKDGSVNLIDNHAATH